MVCIRRSACHEAALQEVEENAKNMLFVVSMLHNRSLSTKIYSSLFCKICSMPQVAKRNWCSLISLPLAAYSHLPYCTVLLY